WEGHGDAAAEEPFVPSGKVGHGETERERTKSPSVGRSRKSTEDVRICATQPRYSLRTFSVCIPRPCQAQPESSLGSEDRRDCQQLGKVCGEHEWPQRSNYQASLIIGGELNLTKAQLRF